MTPGTKLIIHLSGNVPADIRAYSQASLVTSSPIEEGTEETVPGAPVSAPENARSCATARAFCEHTL